MLKSKKVQWGIILFCAVVIVIILIYSEYVEKEQSEKLHKLAEAEYSKNMMEVYDNQCETGNTEEFISASSVINGSVSAEVIIDPIRFKSGVLLSNALVTYKTNANAFSENDILICQFEAYTREGNASLKIDYGNETNTVYLSQTPTTYYIPMMGLSGADTLSFRIVTDYVETVIDKVYLINYADKYTIAELKTGCYARYDEKQDIVIQNNSIAAHGSIQCLIKEDYLFSIDNADGNLYTYQKQEDGSYSEISSLSHLGSTRDMEFNDNQTALIITSRQNGMYIVDITEPSQLKILSHYDTLEATTGLDVYGDYAFLCSRYFGVEIVNIADLCNPYFVNKISNNCEYQDCFIDGQYLYVGVYKEKRIDIWDISDLSKPTNVSVIELDGSGQGCYVRDGILFVATGLNSANNCESIYQYGTGTGNGLEIYDVSDVFSPKKISVVKTEGRYNYSGRDVWDVKVSENYAYLSSMYNGCFVYDISDLTNPVCIRKYTLNTPADGSYDDKYLYSWNVKENGRGAVNHVAIDDGYLLISITDEGIFKEECDFAKKINRDKTYQLMQTSERIKDSIAGSDTMNVYNTDSCIWSCAEYEEYIYLAAGTAGIQILDNKLNLVNTVETNDNCRDIKIYNGYLFSAESTAGISVYKIEQSTLTKISELRMDDTNYYVSQIQLTEDGKYIVAQVSPSQHIVIDSSNISSLKVLDRKFQGTGAMYYRNICTGLVSGKYVGIFGKNKICWYSSENGELLENWVNENDFYRERGGMTSVGDKCLAIISGGYKLFDITSNESSDVIKIKGIDLAGKVICSGKNLVVSNTCDGKIEVVDISDISNPKLISEIKMDIGNPDIACITDSKILIPLRYGGMLQINGDY